MSKPKYKTVLVEAQVVSSDGFPVNGHGVEFGRGWKKNTEMVKRRRRIKWTIVTDKRFACRGKNKVAWTYDKEEAKSWAAIVPGAKVVDAEEFIKEFEEANRRG